MKGALRQDEQELTSDRVQRGGGGRRLRVRIPVKHFGFGGGLVHYSLHVDAEPSGEDFAGNIDLTYNGINAHLFFIWGQP